jgi:hypothetical protein
MKIMLKLHLRLKCCPCPARDIEAQWAATQYKGKTVSQCEGSTFHIL